MLKPPEDRRTKFPWSGSFPGISYLQEPGPGGSNPCSGSGVAQAHPRSSSAQLVLSTKQTGKCQPFGAGEESICIKTCESHSLHPNHLHCWFASHHSPLGRTNITVKAVVLFPEYMHAIFRKGNGADSPKTRAGEPSTAPLPGWHLHPIPALLRRSCHPITALEIGLGMTGGWIPQGHFQPSNTRFVRELSSKSLPGKAPCACHLPRAADANPGSPS